MVANVHGPQFSGGANIAIKCPAHTYEQTVAFYRDTIGLPMIEEETDGCIFQFGPNRLWVDKVPNLSQPDIWLELETNDTDAAASFLKVNGVTRRDEVEQLREDFDGFFVASPNGMIHLVIVHEELYLPIPQPNIRRLIDELVAPAADLNVSAQNRQVAMGP